jgi:digeranylgeranylglycerophospholipid reductase
MNTYDCAIVGGGPIGCFIGEQLALHAKEKNIAIFEEHASIGEPRHCAGLVSPRVFDITHCPKQGILQNTISGAIIHSPDGSTLTIGGDRTHALVINRKTFDEYLARRAQNAGTSLFNQHKVITAAKQNTHITLNVTNDKKHTKVQCTLLIGADGSLSCIRRSFDFPKPKETLHGVGAEVTDTQIHPRFVHIFLGNAVAPGFFAWIIPTNKQGTAARIGLCIKKSASQSLYHCFTTFLKTPLLQEATVLRRFGGTIPLGALRKTVDNHVMLVGDAAAQVKPTSGGGLYTGLLSAQHLVRTVREAFEQQHVNEAFLQRYHQGWTKEISRELYLGMRFRSVFKRLTDDQLNKYLNKFNKEKIINIINTYGDIDYPSRLALPLIKAMPSLISLTPTLLKRMKK